MLPHIQTPIFNCMVHLYWYTRTYINQHPSGALQRSIHATTTTKWKAMKHIYPGKCSTDIRVERENPQ